MLVAPKAAGGHQFHDTAYTNFNKAFQSAVQHALPELTPTDYGGGTPRKSFAQWLNAAGVPRHVIADICGWSLQNRDAMDGYMHTSPDMMLAAKASLPGPSYS